LVLSTAIIDVYELKCLIEAMNRQFASRKRQDSKYLRIF
jgi:hypothetical protein